jgi:hypothetical protein
MTEGDTAVLRAVGRFQNQNISNTFHYTLTTLTTPDSDALANLVAFWATDIVVTWVGVHSDAYELIGVKAFVALGTSARPGYAAVGAVGSVVGDPQESFVCRVLTRYTDNVNPRVRGRLNLSGGVEAMFNDDDGSVTAAHIAELLPLATLLDAPIVGGDAVWTPAIVDKVAQTAEPITKSVPRVTPSVIRTRRIRQFSIG